MSADLTSGPANSGLFDGVFARGIPLRGVLLATPETEGRLTRAGITAEQVERALDPAGYLGASQAFITEALKARAAANSDNGDRGGHGR